MYAYWIEYDEAIWVTMAYGRWPSAPDFRIVIVSEPGSKPIFDVLHGGTAVSRNTVRRDAEAISI